MKTRAGYWMAVGVGAALISTLGIADAATPSELAADARAAVNNFRPLTAADVAQAKTELSATLESLEQRLARAGENGGNWRKFLQLDMLQTELAKAQPDLSVLDRIDTRFAAGHAGLELKWFADARRALEQYVAIARGVDDSKLPARYAQLLDGLAQHLEAYGRNPGSSEAQRVSVDLRWLITARQAPELVTAIRGSLQTPNGFADVSQNTVNAAIGDSLDECTPVRDCILGTSIVGTGHTQGQLGGRLMPDCVHATIDAVFCGQTQSNSVGSNGPATICTSSATNLASVKRMWMDEDGLSALPSLSDAQTASTITGIHVDSPFRIVLKIATRRSYQQQPTAEHIASQHAAQRLNERMNSQAAEIIARNNEAYQQRIREPLIERNLLPQLRFSSTSQSLQAAALAAQAFQITAILAPPSPVEGADLNVRVHESLVNNSAATTLGGMILRDDEVQDYARRLLGYVPDELKPDAEKEPWSIRFANQEPVTVSFGDDLIRITMRGAQYVRGDGTYPAMNVTATYKIVRAGGDVKAVRQGPVEVLPPRFTPGSGEQLSGREVAIRSLLEKRFSKIFRTEVTSKDLVLQPRGQWAKVGAFSPIYMASKAGWLSVAWRRIPAAAVQPAPQVTMNLVESR